MKLIHRYLLKELLVPFFLGLVLFTGILISQQLFDITDLIITRGFSPLNILLFTVASIPGTFYFTVPMAILMGVLMAYGRLAAEMELTIMRASGLPMRSLLIPPMVAGILLTSGLLVLREYGLPGLARLQATQLAEMESPSPPDLMTAGRYLDIGKYTIYAEKIEQQTMTNLYLEDRHQENPMVINARRGKWLQTNNNQYQLLLIDGTIHQRTETGYRNIQFTRQTFPFETVRFSAEDTMDIEDAASLSRLYRRLIDSRTELQLLSDRPGEEKISEQQKKTYQSVQRKTRQRAISFHRALAIPFASFFLILVAAPFGMLARQSGKSIGFVLSLLIIFFYYMLMTFSEPLAMEGWISPGLASWCPNILFGIMGICLLGYLHLKGK